MQVFFWGGQTEPRSEVGGVCRGASALALQWCLIWFSSAWLLSGCDRNGGAGLCVWGVGERVLPVMVFFYASGLAGVSGRGAQMPRGLDVVVAGTWGHQIWGYVMFMELAWRFQISGLWGIKK